ncbi:helix-turn-helix domain-containing protein [Aestuariicella sp. G3-2]|uniref:helix-turn-helix domain-containing protein n=1 Tax=Pseudomaricurvus albidus TaxID=2842452 RepID=UPI001C0BB5CA|nr:helix-turn-helix domain-containing protein [Aestuariicella albida]MBU3068787.1 helix-turn-helix domain-containing protein [Aestuariicella albida]
MIKDRLIELIDRECPNERTKNKDFEQKTGIKKETVRAICNNRQRINEEHIQAIAAAFPEYKHWLVFGEELPEVGQISPMTKATQENYKAQG